MSDGLAALDGSAAAVRAFVRDVDDLLASMAVGGLAWPDPDLGPELTELARRAGELGLSAGRRRLDGLAAAVGAIRDVEAERRGPAVRDAFEAWMGLIGWQRLFRTEADLLQVQAALLVRGRTDRGDGISRAQVADARVDPVGLELVGERIAIHGIDTLDGGPVVLMDQLADPDPSDPLHRPAISRLFQDRVALFDVLGHCVRLSAHPVRTHAGVRVFRPAFDRAPRLEVLDGPRRVPERAALDDAGQPVPGDRATWSLPITAGRTGERTAIETTAGARLVVPETAVLRFTLSKLAMRDGAPALIGLFRARSGQPTLLAVDDAASGRCYPTVDPRAFGLSAVALRDRIREAGPGSTWLRAVLARASAQADPELDRCLAELEPHDLEAAWRLARAARVVGREVPARCAPWIARALSAPDPDAVAVYRALWLGVVTGALDELRPALGVLWTGRYERSLKEPTPLDLCSRALLMDVLDVPPAIDLPDAPAAAVRAAAFLDAHIASVRLAARAHEPRLPSVTELVALAETRVSLTGDSAQRPMAALDLPPDLLRLIAIEAIWGWFAQLGPPDVAGDAAWLLELAGLGPQLWRRVLGGPRSESGSGQ